MPSWIPHAALWVAGSFGVLWAGVAVLGRLRELLVVLLAALFVSFAFEPAIAGLQRRGWRRGTATGALFALVVLAFGALVASIGALVAAQGTSLVEDLPSRAAGVVELVEEHFDVDLDTSRLTGPDGVVSRAADGLSEAAVEKSVSAARLLAQLLATGLFAFYLTADGPRLRRALCSLVRPERQGEVLRVFELAIDKTGGYLYSRAVLAVLAFAVHAVSFSAIGLPYALPYALWVAVISQFVPVVGTALAGGVPVLISLGASPTKAVVVLAVFTVFTQVKNLVLAPRLARTTVELHPAVGFGSVLAGAALLGPVGALLAIPAAATTQAFVTTYLHRHELAHDGHGLLAVPNPPATTRARPRRRTTATRGRVSRGGHRDDNGAN